MVEAGAEPERRRRRRRHRRAAAPQGRIVNDPDNPLADANGNVRAPDMDMSSQMTQLVMAQRGYQASVQVTKNAQETYASALQIGRP